MSHYTDDPRNILGSPESERYRAVSEEYVYGREQFSGPVYVDPGFAARVAKRVAELSDRSSPEDWPEAMLVTADELIFIINDELRETPPEGAPL